MKRKCSACALFLAVLLAGTPSVEAGQEKEGPVLTLGVKTGRLAGSTLYHITVPAAPGLLESELEWSLDSWLGGVTASLEGRGPWRADLSLLTNLSGGSGSMEDYDWINGLLFVFSQSEVEMDTFSAIILDVSGGYRFLRTPQYSLSGVAGFLYQSFDLTAANLKQYSPLGLEAFEANVAGPVVTYSVTYAVPYLGASLALVLSPKLSVTLEARGGYARAEDEDDHLLRFKRSRADTEGFALMGKALGVYSVTPHLSLTASLEALTIETSGDQSQIFYHGPAVGTGFTGIANELDSGQVLLAVGGTYRF